MQRETRDARGAQQDSLLASLLSSADREYLLSPNGRQVKVSDLDDKVVGLYYSANWYTPCQKFTQLLVSVYDQLKKSGVRFEVVFVSTDEDGDAFQRYYACMPWLAIPFSELESRRALSKKFQIEGIPALVLLQTKDGEMMVEQDGVELVYKYGPRAFPFSVERIELLDNEEKEKHDRQTMTELLTNSSRDFLQADFTKQDMQTGGQIGTGHRVGGLY
uniref:protein-disulfide reductase n=1 Tax=Anthurium amnicola TaxID=1678845 RepID=A0A1D1YWM3_9ARAE